MIAPASSSKGDPSRTIFQPPSSRTSASATVSIVLITRAVPSGRFNLGLVRARLASTRTRARSPVTVARVIVMSPNRSSPASKMYSSCARVGRSAFALHSAR